MPALNSLYRGSFPSLSGQNTTFYKSVNVLYETEILYLMVKFSETKLGHGLELFQKI